MIRSKRLAIVIDIAHKDKENAANKLIACQANYDEQQQRLIELNDYYNDYDQRFKSTTNGIRANDFAAKRNFLDQLSLVIKQQKNNLIEVEGMLEKVKHEWQKCHLKCENLQRFVVDLQRQEMLAAEKTEQRTIDDWITQSHHRKLT